MQSTFFAYVNPTAVVACAALSTPALAMAVAGFTQRRHRGFAWWLMSPWLQLLLALGLIAAGPLNGSPVLSLCLALLPILALMCGLRGFYRRHAFATPAWVDVMLPLLGLLACGLAWGQGMSPSSVVALSSMVKAACCGHVAWQIQSLRQRQASACLSAIWWGLLAASLAQWPAMAGHSPEVLAMQMALEPFGGLVTLMLTLWLSPLCLRLVAERTEQEMRESHRQLRTLADFDMLTQVPNRRHFNDMAAQSLRLATPGSTALLIFDIDHFKQVNDTHGHAAGDEALKLVARSARRMLRSHDVVGRLGGDEFVALLPETRLEDALFVADRMVRHIDAQAHAQPGGHVSLSFGVVQIEAEESLDEALHRADLALYEAKRQGRRRAVAAQPSGSTHGFLPGRDWGLAPR